MTATTDLKSGRISVVIPANNEAAVIGKVLQEVRAHIKDAELIVVDDGSTDDTARIAAENGARVLSHPYNIGNGAAVKTGARSATGDIIVFMDGDGQHKPSEISMLLKKLDEGYDMVVGARGPRGQANAGRSIANRCYNWLAGKMVGRKIDDLTSGFRAVNAKKFRRFMYLLPNGFSYPTTITMAFFRAGYRVAYVPIDVQKRKGKSHIKLFSDGMRFIVIILRIGTLYSPLKLFIPISFSFFLTGLSYYLYTFLTIGRFTNMSALLISTSAIMFLIGIVSEQITNLLYSRIDDDN